MPAALPLGRPRNGGEGGRRLTGMRSGTVAVWQDIQIPKG